MDFSKLEGLLSAIEGEAATPSPSHQNLARLVGLILKAIVEHLNPKAIAPEPASAVDNHIAHILEANALEPIVETTNPPLETVAVQKVEESSAPSEASSIG